MNESIRRLYEISQKPSRYIIGLMSGTSLDGLDIACCEIHGHGKSTRMNLLHFDTIPYKSAFKNELRNIFSKQTVETENLCLLNNGVARLHASMVNQKLKDWGLENSSIDLIASHGQTVYHAPSHAHGKLEYGNATLQIGDGDILAFSTGIITIADFRQKHIAAGGEGAPLAAYGDYIRYANSQNPVMLINIGGISNLSFIPAEGGFESITCTDIGPGNKLMDEWMQYCYPHQHYDKNGEMASKGDVNSSLLATLKTDPFFKLPFPKSTGPELFNLKYVLQAIDESETNDIPQEDVMATLNRFTVEMISHAIRQFTSDNRPCDILISGGGVHNPVLFESIKENFTKHPVIKAPNADAKEAILFAILANETIAGDSDTFGMGSATMPNLSMGKICLPK